MPRTKFKEVGRIPIPDYRIGSVVKKGDNKYVIIEDHIPGDTGKCFTFVSKTTHKKIGGLTPFTLAVFGYKIVRQLDIEQVNELIQSLIPTKKRKRQIRKKQKSRRTK